MRNLIYFKEINKRREMNRNGSIFNTVGMAVVLLLIAGAGLNLVYAQGPTTLGEPFFVEKGKITSQKEIGPNTTQFSFSSDGTLNGNVEVINTGNIVSVSKGNNSASDQGQGVISTKDTKTANYSLIGVERVTQEGKLEFQGVTAYSTNSTGKLSFMNNILGFFKGEGDLESGNFVSTEWEMK